MNNQNPVTEFVEKTEAKTELGLIAGRRTRVKGDEITAGVEFWRCAFSPGISRVRDGLDERLDVVLTERRAEICDALEDSRRDAVPRKKLAPTAVADLNAVDRLLDWIEAQGPQNLTADGGLVTERRRYLMGNLFNFNHALIQHGLRNGLEEVRALALKANARHWRFFVSDAVMNLFGAPWMTATWRSQVCSAFEVMAVLMDNDGLSATEQRTMAHMVQDSFKRPRGPGEMITRLPPWLLRGPATDTDRQRIENVAPIDDGQLLMSLVDWMVNNKSNIDRQSLNENWRDTMTLWLPLFDPATVVELVGRCGPLNELSDWRAVAERHTLHGVSVNGAPARPRPHL